MSTRRVRSSSGYVNPAKLPKGPNGRALCLWCHQRVTADLHRRRAEERRAHQGKVRLQGLDQEGTG